MKGDDTPKAAYISAYRVTNRSSALTLSRLYARFHQCVGVVVGASDSSRSGHIVMCNGAGCTSSDAEPFDALLTSSFPSPFEKFGAADAPAGVAIAP